MSGDVLNLEVVFTVLYYLEGGRTCHAGAHNDHRAALGGPAHHSGDDIRRDAKVDVPRVVQEAPGDGDVGAVAVPNAGGRLRL